MLLKTILRTFYVAPIIPRYKIQLFVLKLCLKSLNSWITSACGCHILTYLSKKNINIAIKNLKIVIDDATEALSNVI